MSWAAEEWRAAEVFPACRNTKASCSTGSTIMSVQEVSQIRAALILHYWTNAHWTRHTDTAGCTANVSLPTAFVQIFSENLCSFFSRQKVQQHVSNSTEVQSAQVHFLLRGQQVESEPEFCRSKHSSSSRLKSRIILIIVRISHQLYNILQLT